MSRFTPEMALQQTGPTKGFMCKMDANTYRIEFYSFTIRDMETGRQVFSVERSPEDYLPLYELMSTITPEQERSARSIHYRFPSSMLRRAAIGARLVFGVNSDHPVPNFRMIERHYFRNVLIKSFDFSFGFCIPHSTNTWEAIYDMPKLNPEWEQALISSPFETESDSFYFVGDQLVMHNKAYYAYDGTDEEDE